MIGSPTVTVPLSARPLDTVRIPPLTSASPLRLTPSSVPLAMNNFAVFVSLIAAPRMAPPLRVSLAPSSKRLWRETSVERVIAGFPGTSIMTSPLVGTTPSPQLAGSDQSPLTREDQKAPSAIRKCHTYELVM